VAGLELAHPMVLKCMSYVRSNAKAWESTNKIGFNGFFLAGGGRTMGVYFLITPPIGQISIVLFLS